MLKPGGVAVFNSNDIMPTNADGVMKFRQNNDLLYLSGIDQEETILVIFPDSKSSELKEMLFIRETSEEIMIWEGEKITKEQASEISGIETVFWVYEFENIFKSIASECEHLYLNTNEHLRAKNPVETRDDRFRSWCKEKYPHHKYERSAPIMHRLRSIKEPEEIEMMRKACEITNQAFRSMLKMIKPGVMEYEIEAHMTMEFLRRGSRGSAYDPIIASGFGSCVLHYVSNNKECVEGDILLMDFGSEYGNYASDLSRTVPVSGRYSERQRAVYDAVLRVMKQSKELLTPGKLLGEYHVEVGKLMEQELVGLSLLKQGDVNNQDPANPLYKEYFMHGNSHFIGLDVHDVGIWTEPIKEGMTFTCEPGIYIREEKLGVRIENNIMVTSNGPMDLMEDIPVEAEEIEDIMNSLS